MKPFPKIEGIHAIPVPLPDMSDLITANVYVLGKGPVTLIDTGPKVPGALETIREGLNGMCLDFQDIERMIFTHGHLDHFGLASEIRRAAGHEIECFIHGEDRWQLSKEDIREGILGEEADEFMEAVGLPEKERENIRRRFASFMELSDPLDQASLMGDGDEFAGEGYHLRVIHTPGHTPGCCCLYETGTRVLFSGDHIIKHITPNPLVVLKRERLTDPDYRSLKAHRDSLDKLKDLDAAYVFTGHGEYVEDLPGIIASYETHRRERMDLIRQVLKKKQGPLYLLVDDIFPHVPEGDLFLAMSEIVVHLEVLIEEGRAELVDPGPPALYRAL